MDFERRGKIEALREAINPERLDRTPNFAAPLLQDLPKALAQANAAFKEKLGKRNGTKINWSPFEEAAKAYEEAHAGFFAPEEHDRARQKRLIRALFAAPLTLRRKRELLAFDYEKATSRLSQKRMDELKNDSLKRMKEDAEWQHRMASFILIHRDTPELPGILAGVWTGIRACDDLSKNAAVEGQLKNLNRRGLFPQEAQGGITRLVTGGLFFLSLGAGIIFPTKEQDVELSHDIYAGPWEKEEPVFVAVQIKPLEVNLPLRLSLEIGDAQRLPPGASDELRFIAENLVRLKRATPELSDFRIVAMYLKIPGPGQRPDIAAESGLASLDFLEEAGRSLDSAKRNLIGVE
jgi:hypothetical protein